MVQMNRRSGLDTKKKVLDAAMKVFSANGYAGASMRAIAKAAGVSVGGVYLYFRNKGELYLDLIKDRAEEQTRKTGEIAVSAGSSTDALNSFISLHLEYGMKHKELILITIREHGFIFGKEVKKKFLRAQIRTLQKILGEGTRSGEFRECEVEETAKIIMATLRGVVLSIAMEGDNITEKGVKDLILKGLVRNGKDDFRKKDAGKMSKEIKRQFQRNVHNNAGKG
jgi:AcrR family transcriptional regulator